MWDALYYTFQGPVTFLCVWLIQITLLRDPVADQYRSAAWLAFRNTILLFWVMFAGLLLVALFYELPWRNLSILWWDVSCLFAATLVWLRWYWFSKLPEHSSDSHNDH